MSNWTHAICEACWIAEETSFDGAGNPVSIRRPIRLNMPEEQELEAELCCMCGNITIWGVYTRRDPDEVNWLRTEDGWTERIDIKT